MSVESYLKSRDERIKKNLDESDHKPSNPDNVQAYMDKRAKAGRAYTYSKSTDTTFDKIAKSLGIGHQLSNRAYELAETKNTAYTDALQLANKSNTKTANEEAYITDYSSYLVEPDFKELAESGSTMKYGLPKDRTPWQETKISTKAHNTYFMTDDERAIFNYALAKGGKDSAKEYLTSIDKELNSRGTESASRGYQSFASENPVGGLIANLTSTFLSPAGYLSALKDNITGDSDDIDTNSSVFLPTMVENATRNGIKDKVRDTFGLGSAGDFATDIGLSTLQSVPRMLMGSPGLAVAGLGAASSGYKGALDRGGSNKQGMILGGLEGGAEAFFEKFSLENWGKLKGAPIRTAKDAIKNLLKQSAIEGSEELATEISNTVSDQVVMGELSNYNLGVENYQKQGYSKTEATQKASLDVLENLGLATAGGALSGGMLGGAGMGINYVGTSQQGKVSEYSGFQDIADSFDMKQESYSSPKDYETVKTAYDLALELAQKESQGKKVTNYQKGMFDRTMNDAAGIEITTQESENNGEQNTRAEDGSMENVTQPIDPLQEHEVDPPAPQMNTDNMVRGTVPVPVVSTLESQEPMTHAIQPEQYISEYANQFSENGKKAFESNYKDTIPMDIYDKGFKESYNAGRYDLDYDLLNSAASSIISDDAVFNAYKAGIADRNVALNIDLRTGKPKTGGLTGTTQTATANMNNLADAVGKKTGLQFIIADSLPYDANGQYNSTEGKVYISTNTDNFSATVSHELTHFIKDYSPESYQRYQDVVVASLAASKNISIEQLIEEYTNNYTRTGDNMDRDSIMDEISADATERFMNDEEFINQIVEDDKTLGQKILDFLQDMVESLKSMINSKVNSKAAKILEENLETYEHARDLWYDALKDASIVNEIKGKSEPDANGNINYQLKGIQDGIEVYETSEMTKNLPIAERKKNLLESILQEYKGRTAKFTKNGNVYYASLDEKGIRKGIYGDKKSDKSGYKNKINIGADGNYFELVENAKYNSTSAEIGKSTTNRAHSGVLQWDYYQKTIKSDGKYFDVLVNVRDIGNNQFVYDISLNENRKKDSQAAQPKLASSQENPISNSSITQNDGDIKSQILHQLKNISEVDLIHENERLKETNEFLAKQLTLTKEYVPKAKDVSKIASGILKEYNSQYDKGVLEDNLSKLFKYIQNTKVIDGAEVTSVTSSIAKAVLEKSSTLDYSMQEMYPNLKKTIKEYNIKLSQQDMIDLDSYGGYNQFRKDNFGKLSLTKEGTPIDSIYQELSYQYPELFSDSITHPADQLIAIADVVDTLAPAVVNEYGANIDEMSYIVSNEIFDKYFDIRPQSPTFADKQAAKLDQTKVEYRRRIADVKADMRSKYDIRIDDVKKRNIDKIQKLTEKYKQSEGEQKEYYKDQIRKLREYKNERLLAQQQRYQERIQNSTASKKERTAVSKYKKRIIRNTSDLSKWLLSPNEKKHVPEELRGIVAEFLSSIDFSSNKLNKYGEPTARTILWQKLSDAYQQITNGMNSEDGGSVFMEIDPNFIDRLKEFIGGTDTVRLEDMNSIQLKDLSHLVEIMKHSIQDANKLISNAQFEHVEDLATAIKDEKDEKKNFKEHVGFKREVSKLFNVDMLDSYSYFRQFGNAGMSIYESLRKGFDKKVVNTKIASDYIADLLGKTSIKEWTGIHSKLNTFHTANGDLNMTDAQIMSLYVLNKREQARGHMYDEKGGIKPSRITVKGKLKTNVEKAFSPIRVTEVEVDSIVNTLSDEQKRIADGIADFFVSQTSEWGNEVSMKLYGYKKFAEKNYFPIVSDSNYLVSQDGDKSNEMSTLKNLGMTKSTVKGANNPIIIEDIFDVFVKQADQMSSYNAFVVPLSDLQKVFNYKQKGGFSVKQTIERVFGENGKQYLPQLMKDINGSLSKDRGIGDFMLNNMKAASVGANLRVIIQQPTSYVRALAEIDGSYLVQGILKVNKKGDWDKIKRYAPIAQWKDWGFFELDTGRQMKEILLGTEGFSKFKEMSMAGAGIADTLTWQKLWNAVEYEVLDKNTSLLRDSEVFYEEVGKRFSEIIDRTQVVDTVLHRTQIMRSQNSLKKMSTSFMSEPSKNYNLLRNAISDAVVKRTPNAKIHLARISTVYVLSSAATALAAALIDAIRDDDEQTFLDKYSEAFTNNFIDNVNPLNMIPYVKDVVSIFSGFLSPTRMDLAGVSDFAKASLEWVNYINGESKYTLGYLLLNSIASLSKLTGLPVANIKRDLEAVLRMVTETLPLEDQYKLSKYKLSISGEKNIDTYINMIITARDNGEKILATDIYNDMISAEIDNEKMNIKIESKSKKMLIEDPLIAQLYEAHANISVGDIANVNQQLLDDGYAQKWIDSAVKSYGNSLKEEDEPTYNNIGSIDEIFEDDSSGGMYSNADMFTAIDAGKWKEFNQISSELYNEKIKSGKTANEARGAIKSSLTSKYKPQYLVLDYNGRVKIMQALKKVKVGGEYLYSAEDLGKWSQEADK